jgi:hypothetical protein
MIRKNFIGLCVLIGFSVISCNKTDPDLNKDKQQIVENVSPKNISSEKTRSTFETYVNNKAYFIKTFDINKDGIPDKIVSSMAYQGEDLFVFFGEKSGGYLLSLETTNFSEDGGNIIKDIYEIPNSKGFTVKTYFPDRGYYEKEFNIIPANNTWVLKNIIYKTMSDVSENAVKYICDVTQNIDITKSEWSDKLNSIPEENERSKKCRTENVSGAAIVNSARNNEATIAKIAQSDKEWIGNYTVRFLRMKEESGDPRGWGQISVKVDGNSAKFQLDSYVENLKKDLIVINTTADEITFAEKDNKKSTFTISKKQNKYILKSAFIDQTVGETSSYELEKK